MSCPKTLDFQVQCSGQLLGLLMDLAPAVDNLVLRLANPRAQSEAFFPAVVATNSIANSPRELIALPRPPLSTKLRALRVQYKRWLRSAERKTLIPVFSDIVSSRKSEKYLLLRLIFDRFDTNDWHVGMAMERIQRALGYVI